jgi:hypothetical protein
MVIHCVENRSDPRHEVPIGADLEVSQAPLCAIHKRRIDEGEAWLWVPWQRLKGAGSDLAEGCILMGEELAAFGLVVDADVRMSTSLVFSPGRADGQPTTTLAIDGRVFGLNQPVSLELVLAGETVAQLKEALRFVQP